MLRFRSSKPNHPNGVETNFIGRKKRQNTFSNRRSTLSTTNTREKQKSNSYSSIPIHILLLGVLIVITIIEAIYLSSLLDGGDANSFFVSDSFLGFLRSHRWKEIIKMDSSNVPIDDYTLRPHIKTPVPLIVGGSDGSGTRAFAYLLEQLDVPMVVDDRGTMDVHGKELFNGQGWPPLVSMLLSETRSATYDVDNLPESVQTTAFRELEKLIQEMESRGISRHNAASRPMSSAVSWGFKAPVSLLLLPFFRRQIPAMKFIHIVRDGRDVALSENTSPVKKFYETYFEDSLDRVNAWREEDFTDSTIEIIQAMQLWNDWNGKVYKYIMNEADGRTFDFLVMRAEDLVTNPYETILRLADFVGSRKTPHEMCCISQRSMSDLGKSNHELGLRGKTQSFGVGGFENVRKMFNPLEIENRNPILSWDEIRQRMMENTGDKTVEYADAANEIRRKLTEDRRNDDEIPIELPKDMPRSAINLQKLYQETMRHANEDVPNFNQIMLMEKDLEDHRAMADIRELRDDTTVKERYGKWVKILETMPKLSETLHAEGKESLALFGYEPARTFMDSRQLEGGFRCDRTVICEDLSEQ